MSASFAALGCLHGCQLEVSRRRHEQVYRLRAAGLVVCAELDDRPGWLVVEPTSAGHDVAEGKITPTEQGA